MKRVFRIRENEIDFSIKVNEIKSESYGCYVWPSAVIMSLYVVKNHLIFKGKKVLEIGAGVGLVGMVMARQGASVVLSDAYDMIISNLQYQMQLNALECKVVKLKWGELVSGKFDYIIGSDVFYDTSLFEDVIATVYSCLLSSPDCLFITAYQERSSKHSLDPILSRWNLKGELIADSLDFSFDSFEPNPSEMAGIDSIFIYKIHF
jgi:predicted nicotinamide N-methyase